MITFKEHLREAAKRQPGDVNWGPTPNLPANAPDWIKNSSIPDQRLWLALDKIQHSEYLLSGQLSVDVLNHKEGNRQIKDDYYVTVGPTVDTVVFARDGAGKDKTLWIKEKGFLKIADLPKHSYASLIRDESSIHLPRPIIARQLNLSSLVGAPQSTGWKADFSWNLLQNLNGITKDIGKDEHGELYLFDCGLTNLKDVHKHVHQVGTIHLGGNPIASHVLGLLKIKNLRRVWFVPQFSTAHVKTELDNTLLRVQEIIHKYLPNNRGNEAVLECQNALIDAGLDEYAEL